MNAIRETAIIGGGPAGSATAILLARSGHDVLLLEKSRAPHDKVCGEFLSWEAVHYLTRLGIDLQGLGAQPINRVRLINGETVFETALPFTAWSLSRRLLDESLLTLASRTGANILRGETVKTLAFTDSDWLLSTAHSAYRARNVFLANGKHELPGWTRTHSNQNDSIGFKMHLQLTQEARTRLRETVEVYLFDQGYAGLELIENDLCNLCLLVKKDIYTLQCNKDWSIFLHWLSRRSPYLASMLSGARSIWQNPLAVYAVPYGFLYHPNNSVNRLFRLGDQMAVIPSFAGDGMAIALHSAQLAADTFHAGLDAREYHLKARRAFRSPLRLAGWMTTLASHAAGRHLLFKLANFSPDFIKQIIQQTRLPKKILLQNQ